VNENNTNNPESKKPVETGYLTDTTKSAVEYYAADEIVDIQQIVRIFVKWGWLVILLALLGAAKGVQDAHKFTPASIAKMTVSPIKSSGADAGSTGNRSGFAAIFSGFSLGKDAEITKLSKISNFVKTRAFAELMDKKYGLIFKLWGSSWDDQAEKWRRPEGREFEIREKINRYLRQVTWSEPSVEDLSNFLRGSFVVTKMEGTPYTEIKVENSDPEFALWLLKTVYQEGTEYMRKEEADRLAIQKDFVLARMADTSVVEFKRQLVQTLIDIDRKEMFSTGGLPYAARIIDHPYVSKHKTQPNIVKVVAVPAFIMAILTAVLILIVALYRGESKGR
jgi:hypothetical protein